MKINNRTSPTSELKWLSASNSPWRILGTIALAIFVGETLVMLLIALMPPLEVLPEAFIDSTLLIVLISPALFYFLFLPIIRHVRRREKAEEDLRRNRDLLQAVFNGISEPLILLDNRMNVKMINAAAEQYYNLDIQPLVDQPCYQTFMCRDHPCDECQIPLKLDTENKIVFERRGIFDPHRIEQVVIYRAADISDSPGAVILRITDVTDARIMEKQMRQRERMASLGLLISGVVHEINNPNTFISFNLPILREYIEEVLPITDAYAEGHPDLEIANMPYQEFRRDLFKLVENIVHGSHRIDTIVSKLKEFSHIQDDRKLEPVDVKAVLERVTALAHGQIKRMVHKFEAEVPDGLPRIHTAGQCIEQVTLNLLINACQAADKPDSWVRLKASANPDPPYALCIEVSDNGHGMDEETLKHVFDPLFTTKSPKEGMGMGLYLCHSMVEGLGGRIEARSTPGQGSAFKLLLPDLRDEAR